MSAVTNWTGINGLNDDEAAQTIAGDEIDILVDLNGYTKDARAKVIAQKASSGHRELVRIPGLDGQHLSSLSDRRRLYRAAGA
jgi:hypothetical protein